MKFVSKHTLEKFCLIDNANTSIRGSIFKEIVVNNLALRDYTSAFSTKVIGEKLVKTEN